MVHTPTQDGSVAMCLEGCVLTPYAFKSISRCVLLPEVRSRINNIVFVFPALRVFFLFYHIEAA